MKKWVLTLCLIWPLAGHSAEPSKAFVKLAKKVRSSVVNISVKREGFRDVVQLFPGYFMPFSQPQITGAGSGFIVDKRGLIVTNAHVVGSEEQGPGGVKKFRPFDQIQVQFVRDDRRYPAKVLGADTGSDIALLKVSANKKLKPLPLGDSEKLEVGEWVAAIGNPHDLGHTMTKGIISAVKREIDDLNLFPLIQTDASINVGNSGGPLVNLKGEAVGVNQAIIKGATGISFAVPINNVKEVLADLKSFGYVKRGFIGVFFYNDEQKGAIVTHVMPGSPAQKAGVQVKDRIISFDGKKIIKQKDLPHAVRKAKIGKTASLEIIRNGRTIQLKITPQNTALFSRKTAPAKQKKLKIRGQSLPGGFQMAPASDSVFRHFNLPVWAKQAKHPIVVRVQSGLPAFQGGLKEGDLLFQVNGRAVTAAEDVKKAIKKGKNQLNVLRYHRRYDKFYLVSVRFAI